jgi:preprotein translocase subunit SecD
LPPHRQGQSEKPLTTSYITAFGSAGRIDLHVFPTGVMNVIAAVITATGDHTKMKHFTIDAENNITVHASRMAARDTGAAALGTEEQFADLIGPDNKRLVEIWNSLPGVKPVTKFTNRKVATERIWKAIQGLGERAAAAPVAEPRLGSTNADTALVEIPAAEPATAQATESIATAGAQFPDVASKEARPANQAARSKKPPTGESKSNGTHEGSKAAQVIAMLQRNNGATLAEIMLKFGWQAHTVRGFMAGAMKKAGYIVESFKSAKGDRTYRINR